MSSTGGSPGLPAARTVPTKLHTAPTRWSFSRSRASSAPTSKSACWMVTRAAISAPGDRWEESDLASFTQRCVVLHHHLVERHAHRTAGRQRLGIGRALGRQFVAQRADGGGARLALLAAAAEGLAHRGEVAQLDLH